MTVAATTLGRWQGMSADEFYGPWYAMLVALPLPCLGFWAFRQVLGRAEWAAVLTAYWLLGTPTLPALVDCQSGGINPLNHLLASGGLMLIAGDLLGRRRMWPAAVGIVIAVWSRPHMVFYGIAVLVVAWLVPGRGRQQAGCRDCGGAGVVRRYPLDAKLAEVRHAVRVGLSLHL